MNKTLLALSSVALAAALVGCGNDPGGSSSASPTVNPQDQGVKYAQCMRKHGIQMEDPKPGGRGISLRLERGGEAKLKAAETACKAYAPERAGNGKVSAEDLDQQTKLAQCLRRHGIDVKDPKPNQPFEIKARKSDTQMKKAMQTCSAEAGMSDPGTGSRQGLSEQGGS